jgi:DNA-binding NarL/FixJ family response regulator
MAAKDRCAILLAEDENIALAGMRCVLQSRLFRVAGAVSDSHALLRAVKETRPDVVIADIGIPGMNGLEAVKLIRRLRPGVRFIVLSMNSDPAFVDEALRQGVDGYVLKEMAAADLPEAIDGVCAGRVFVSKKPAAENGGAARAERSESLTKRQREILILLSEGRSAKEAGAILRISPRTVEFHKYRIMEHLRVHSVAQLARYAVTHGIVQ